MKTTVLGRKGQEVSCIPFGTWQLDGDDVASAFTAAATTATPAGSHLWIAAT